MCDCIKVINKKLKDAGTNTKLDIPIVISMGESIIKVDRVGIKTRKLNSKNRMKAQTVMSAYCPFCGDKYSV